MHGEAFAAWGGGDGQWCGAFFLIVEVSGDGPDEACELPAGAQDAECLTDEGGGKADEEVGGDHTGVVRGEDVPAGGVEEDAADEGGDEGEDAGLAASVMETAIEAGFEVFLLDDREVGRARVMRLPCRSHRVRWRDVGPVMAWWDGIRFLIGRGGRSGFQESSAGERG